MHKGITIGGLAECAKAEAESKNQKQFQTVKSVEGFLKHREKVLGWTIERDGDVVKVIDVG